MNKCKFCFKGTMRNKEKREEQSLFPMQLFKGQSVSGGKEARRNNGTKETQKPPNPIYTYL